MKSDIILNELRREIERLSKRRTKFGFFIILSIACISIITILLVLKLKSRDTKDEALEQDEFYEDYYALDYEE